MNQNQPGAVQRAALLLPKAVYFFYYAAASSLLPFIALYYQHLGLAGRHIGLLLGLPALVALFSASLWGGIADRTRQHKRVLTLTMCGTLLSVLLLSLARTFYVLIPLVGLYAFLNAPVMPLIDNTVMDLLGESKNQYGKLRLWGAVGWGLAAPVVGILTDAAGLHWIFTVFLILMAGDLALALGLPASPVTIGGSFWRGFRSLWMNRRWVLFLIPVFIGSTSRGITENFLFLHMADLGADQTLMGLSLAVASVSELPIFFFSNFLLNRWGARGLLALSLLACVVRPLAFSSMQMAWMALPIQLLHGACFSAMQVAGVSYANDIAPPGMGATAQGVFYSVLIGLSTLFGALIGGMLYQGLGGAAMFRWVGTIALSGFLFFVISNRSALVQRVRRVLTRS